MAEHLTDLSYLNITSLISDVSSYLAYLPKSDTEAQSDSLYYASPAALVLFGLFNAVLMLGSSSSLAPLPGHNNGGFWPIYVKEHYAPQTSQNLLDPYSFAHAGHGMLGFIVASLAGADLGVGFILTIASALLWEIGENTEFIINLFRENSGPSEKYHGDSKINVVGDVLTCTMGYALAVLMGRWGGVLPVVALVVVSELAMAAYFRDSIVLMALQMIAPSEEVGQWQLEIIPEPFKNRRYWNKTRRRSNLYSTMRLARRVDFQKLLLRAMKQRSN